MITFAMVTAIVATVGVALVIVGLSAPQPSLAKRLQRVENAAPQGILAGPSRRHSVLRKALGREGGVFLLDKEFLAAAKLLGVDPVTHVVNKVAWLIGAGTFAATAGLAVTATLGLPWYAGGAVVLCALAAAWVLPDQPIKAMAKRQRSSFVASFAAYLDLVMMRSSAGVGTSQALREAALVGDSLGWSMVKSSLRVAAIANQSAPHGLVILGEELDVPQLRSLGDQLISAEITGAQTADSLRAKSAALRAQERHDVIGAGAGAQVAMVFAMLLLLAGFMVLLLYPFFVSVLSM